MYERRGAKRFRPFSEEAYLKTRQYAARGPQRVLRAVPSCDGDKSLRVVVGELAQHDSANEAEDRGVDANAQRQCEEGGGSEAGRAAHQPQRMPKIAHAGLRR